MKTYMQIILKSLSSPWLFIPNVVHDTAVGWVAVEGAYIPISRDNIYSGPSGNVVRIQVGIRSSSISLLSSLALSLSSLLFLSFSLSLSSPPASLHASPLYPPFSLSLFLSPLQPNPRSIRERYRGEKNESIRT